MSQKGTVLVVDDNRLVLATLADARFDGASGLLEDQEEFLRKVGALPHD